MLSKAAKIFGAVMILVGILGFVPGLAPNGHLLGVFHINTAHNFVHILTGAVALWVGYVSEHASKLFFLTFGIIYGLVAILGFIAVDRPVLGFIANNIADAWLHVAIAAVSIVLGLMPERARMERKAPMA